MQHRPATKDKRKRCATRRPRDKDLESEGRGCTMLDVCQEYEYPCNLYLALFPDSTLEILPADFEPSVEYVISAFLAPQNATVLHMLYRDGKSLNDVSDACGLTVEQVQCILSSIRCGLATPDKRQFFEAGVMNLINAVHEFMGDDAQFCVDVEPCYIDEAPDTASCSTSIPTPPPSVLGGTNVSIDAIDLSTRSFNLLRGQGIQWAEEVALLGWDELMEIPQIGEKSASEIVAKMVNLGYPEELFARGKPKTILYGVNAPVPSPSTLGGTNVSLEAIALSARSYNCLRRRGIQWTEEVALLGWDGLMEIRCLGDKSANEIIAKMVELGYPEELFVSKKNKNNGGKNNDSIFWNVRNSCG